jgi:hypothetical protein
MWTTSSFAKGSSRTSSDTQRRWRSFVENNKPGVLSSKPPSPRLADEVRPLGAELVEDRHRGRCARGCTSPCRRAQRRRSTAATDGASLRGLDASLPRRMIAGSPSATDHGGRSAAERREFASPGVHGPCGPGRALALVQLGCERDLERGAGDRSRRRSSRLDLCASRPNRACRRARAARSAGATRGAWIVTAVDPEPAASCLASLEPAMGAVTPALVDPVASGER